MKFRIADNLTLGDDLVVSTTGIFATKGMGKCLGPEVQVLHYDGHVTRADAVVAGDRLMGPDSKPRRVLSCTQGRAPMFTIVPTKGESWRCNDVHTLTLKESESGEIVDIQLDKFLAKSPHYRQFHLLFSTGVDFPKGEGLPLDPYFLGIWFGDGDKTVSPELGLLRVAVTTMDQEIVAMCQHTADQFQLKAVKDPHKGNAFRYRLVNERGVGNALLEMMRTIVGVELTVPPRYLVASRENRLAFLAGWLDSDGHLESGCFDFVQKRKDWTDAVIFLARSLGFRVTRSTKSVDGTVYQRICISGNVDEIPTRLARKRAAPRGQIKDPLRTGFQVVAEGEGDYAGFMVDGDGRFLLGDFTVTHNSHLAQVMAEEMLEHGQVIVAIDPTDAWYGLRSTADGLRDGYPILVIGGDHGDLKLEPEVGAGIRLAEAIVAERFSCVICTDGVDDTLAIRYVREVLSTLFHKNRDPLHVFVDEADIFAPQQPKEEEDFRCIRALAHVVRRGRKKGIGTTLITQRPAELNATVRTMVEMLFVLGMLHNLDIDAVEKWLRLRKKKRGSNGAFELQEQMIESLDTLQRGDAWVWSPRMKIHKRFRAREKRTFDSGATPTPGKKARRAKKLAPVDIARLGAAIAEAAKRQKDSDPAELRKQVALLRKELEHVGKGQDRAETNEKALHAEGYEHRVRIAQLEKELAAAKQAATIRPADLRRLEALVKKIDKLILRITGTNADLELHLTGLRTEVTKLQGVADRVITVRGKKSASLVTDVLALVEDDGGRRAPVPVKPVPVKPVVKAPIASSETGDLKPAHLRLLTAIAWWESIGITAPDLGGVAFAAKTTTKSSAFDNNRSWLRARGYIEYPSTGHVQLTGQGRAVAPPPGLAPTNEALQETILQAVTPAHGRLLRVLITEYPEQISLDDLAKRSGTSTSSSAFDNNRSWLRARGLAEYPRTGFVRATQLLFPQGAA